MSKKVFYTYLTTGLYFVSGLAFLVLVIVIKILPPDLIKTLISKFTFFSEDGKIQNTMEIFVVLHKLLPLFIWSGIGCLALAFALLYLLSSSNRTYYGKDSNFHSQKMIFERKDIVALFFYPALFVALCWPVLNQSLWSDEAATMLRYVFGDWSKLLAPTSANNHIFSSFLIRLSIGIFGLKEWAIRLPALLSGIFVVIGAYCLSKRVGQQGFINHLVALFASTTFGVAFFSTNARGYIIVMATTIWLGILFCDMLNDEKKSFYISYIMLGVISVITLPISIFNILVFTVLFVWMAALKKCNPYKAIDIILSLTLIFVVAGCVYLWSLPQRILFIATRHSWGIQDIKNFSVNIFSYWGGLMNNSFSGSLLIFATIFGLVSLLKRNALPALYIFSCIFAAILMQIKSGSISLRFSSQGLVFVPIILGEALARIDKLGTKFSIRVYSKIAVILVSCLFLITNIISISWLWGKRSYAKEIVDNVANQKQPVQLFVVRPVAKSLQYYFKQKGLGFREYVNLEEFEHPTEPNNLRLIIMCYLVPSRLVYSANKHYVRLRGWAESFTIVLPSEYSDLFKKYEHNK